MTKQEAIELLKNRKVYVNGKSAEIQKKLFEIGFRWGDYSQSISHTKMPFLFIRNDLSFGYSSDMEFFINNESKEISSEKILAIEPVQEFKENDVIVSGWKLPTGEVCEWIAVVKKWTRNDDGDGFQDYTAKVALCTKDSRTRDNFGLDLDNGYCAGAEWSRPATDAEKEELKSALYLSSNPKAQVILKDVFGIEEKPEESLQAGAEKSGETLKPFDRVLVRYADGFEWGARLFDRMVDGEYGCTDSLCYKQCIHYEGNEHLLGTTNKPNNKR